MTSLALRAIVVTLVLGAAVALAFVLVRGAVVVLSLFGAIVIGEAVRPLVDRLSVRIPRVVSVAIAFVLVLIAVAVVWFIPIRALMPQVIAIWNEVPTYVADLAAKIMQFSQSDPERAKLVSNLSSSAAATLGPLAQRFFDAQAGVAAMLGTLGLMFVMAMFWLGASAAFAPFVLSMIAPAQRAEVLALFREIGGKFRLYVTSTIVNGAMVAVESIAVLALLRTPYPVVFGVLQGLLIAIPYLGTLIGVLVVGAVVLVTQGWIHAAIAMLAVALVQSLQGTFIAPLIFKRGMDIDPLFIIVATALGGALFGIVGVILAIPAAATVQVLIVRVIAPAIRNSYINLSAGEAR